MYFFRSFLRSIKKGDEIFRKKICLREEGWGDFLKLYATVWAGRDASGISLFFAIHILPTKKSFEFLRRKMTVQNKFSCLAHVEVIRKRKGFPENSHSD